MIFDSTEQDKTQKLLLKTIAGDEPVPEMLQHKSLAELLKAIESLRKNVRQGFLQGERFFLNRLLDSLGGASKSQYVQELGEREDPSGTRVLSGNTQHLEVSPATLQKIVAFYSNQITSEELVAHFSQEKPSIATNAEAIIKASEHNKLLTPFYLGLMAVSNPELLYSGTRDEVMAGANALAERLADIPLDEWSDAMKVAKKSMLHEHGSGTWNTVSAEPNEFDRLSASITKRGAKSKYTPANEQKSGIITGLILKSRETEGLTLEKVIDDALFDGVIAKPEKKSARGNKNGGDTAGGQVGGSL